MTESELIAAAARAGGVGYHTAAAVIKYADDVRRQRDDDLRGEAGSGSESQIATGLLAGEERSAPSPSSDPIRDALIRCLDAYEAHDRWCGHNPDAPGDERLQAFQDAYRVLAEPSVVGTPSSDTVTVDRDDLHTVLAYLELRTVKRLAAEMGRLRAALAATDKEADSGN